MKRLVFLFLLIPCLALCDVTFTVRGRTITIPAVSISDSAGWVVTQSKLAEYVATHAVSDSVIAAAVTAYLLANPPVATDTTSLSNRINLKADSTNNAYRAWVSAVYASLTQLGAKADSTDNATRSWTGAQGYLTSETGDISAVIAGPGITGGATSGAATVGLDTTDDRNITGHWTMAAPIFATPTLGEAQAASINGVGISGPTPGHPSALTIYADGSLITVGGYALTFTATGTTNATVPAGTVTLICADDSNSWLGTKTNDKLKVAPSDSATYLATKTNVKGAKVGHVLGSVFVSKTFTNVGTSWVDVYATAFDAEDMMVLDFLNVDSVRVTFMVDYVGTGNDSTRWVNAADNTQVLAGSKFSGDCDAITIAWAALPLAFVGARNVTIEQQAMSATSTNDPVYKGYAIYGK